MSVLDYDTFPELQFGVPKPDSGAAGLLAVISAQQFATPCQLTIGTVHLPYGFSSIKLVAVTAAGAQFGPPGYEANLLYLASLAALVLGGSGPLSVDGHLRSRQRGTRRG